MRSGILLGSAGGVFAEEVVYYRLRIADLSQRVAEILGASRVRSGKLDDEPPYVVGVVVTAPGERVLQRPVERCVGDLLPAVPTRRLSHVFDTDAPTLSRRPRW
jgi:hypothetical protein